MSDVAVPIVDPGDEYWSLFKTLNNDLTELHIDWRQFRKLFGTNPTRIELLNHIAPGFFSRMQWIILGHVAISISRLFDPATINGRSNVVLAGIIDALKDPSQARLRERLAVMLEELRTLAAPIIKLRHKRLAHRDKQTAMGLESLPGVSRDLVEKVLSGIRELMNQAQLAIRGSSTLWELSDISNDGDALVYGLRKAAAFAALIESGVLPRDSMLRLPYADP